MGSGVFYFTLQFQHELLIVLLDHQCRIIVATLALYFLTVDCLFDLLLVNLDADAWLAILVDDLEREVLDVGLDRLVGELLANETFLVRSS